MSLFIPTRFLWLSLSASTAIFFYLYLRERCKTRRAIDIAHEAAKVLFFPDTNTLNRTGALEELSSTLRSASNSLSVCVFTISNWKLIDILIGAHQRGVIVRVITDKDQMSVNPTPVEKLRRNGIQVRHNNDSYFMHHKFAIVDERCLVNGSLNWTQQGVHGNQENLVILSKAEVVRPFLEQFEHLWEKFHPRNYCTSDLN